MDEQRDPGVLQILFKLTALALQGGDALFGGFDVDGGHQRGRSLLTARPYLNRVIRERS